MAIEGCRDLVSICRQLVYYPKYNLEGEDIDEQQVVDIGDTNVKLYWRICQLELWKIPIKVLHEVGINEVKVARHAVDAIASMFGIKVISVSDYIQSDTAIERLHSDIIVRLKLFYRSV